MYCDTTDVIVLPCDVVAINVFVERFFCVEIGIADGKWKNVRIYKNGIIINTN